VVLSAANPKNLLLAVAGAVAVAGAGLSAGDETLAWIVFVLVASIGVAAPVVISFAMGSRSRELLDRLKGWMAHNNAVIMAVLLLLIGVKLIGDAISGFST
jgi:threonine/homoserine/homoserine lactone efflux protein